MQLKFIGTGGAFDYEYLNSAAIVSVNGLKVLIDCGHAIYPALRKLDATDKIDYALITHFHDDHVGSLSSLLIYSLYFHNKKLTILYPDDNFLRDIRNFLVFTLSDPDKYVNFQPVSNFGFIGSVNTFDHHVAGLQTFAYYFEENDKRVVYSGDLGNCDMLFNFLESLGQKDTTVFHDVTFNRENKAHTYYKNLEPYTDRYKIIGYHCDPTINPPDNKIPLAQNLPEYLLAS